MLENYKTDKLHHPSNNDTKTMQKQCCFFLSNKFQAGMAKFAFFFVCAHVVHVMFHTHIAHSRKMQIDTVPSKMK